MSSDWDCASSTGVRSMDFRLWEAADLGFVDVEVVEVVVVDVPPHDTPFSDQPRA